jgi:hypothetical protein
LQRVGPEVLFGHDIARLGWAGYDTEGVEGRAVAAAVRADPPPGEPGKRYESQKEPPSPAATRSETLIMNIRAH